MLFLIQQSIPWMQLDPSCTNTGIFRANEGFTLPADAVVPCVTSADTTAATTSTMYKKDGLVFRES